MRRDFTARTLAPWNVESGIRRSEASTASSRRSECRGQLSDVTSTARAATSACVPFS
jgi:hypothetical protein